MSTLSVFDFRQRHNYLSNVTEALLHFHGNNGYANARQCLYLRTFFLYSKRRVYGMYHMNTNQE
jgi:hypothetical protein